MSYMLVLWIYGVTVAVIPVQFPTLGQCEKAGDAFKLKAEKSRQGGSGTRYPDYACIPIDLDQP